MTAINVRHELTADSGFWAAQDVGHDTKVGAKDTAKGTEKAADKTGHATKTVAKKTGHAVKKAVTP